MRQVLFLTIIFTILNSSSFAQGKNLLLGHWSICHQDGTYLEETFTEDKIYLFSHRLMPTIAVFQYKIINDTVIITGYSQNSTRGISHKTTFQELSQDRVKWIDHTFDSVVERIRIKDLIDNGEVDTLKVYEHFLTRQREEGCKDKRAKEENQLLDLGEIEDDFEEIKDFPYIKELEYQNQNKVP